MRNRANPLVRTVAVSVESWGERWKLPVSGTSIVGRARMSVSSCRRRLVEEQGRKESVRSTRPVVQLARESRVPAVPEVLAAIDCKYRSLVGIEASTGPQRVPLSKLDAKAVL